MAEFFTVLDGRATYSRLVKYLHITVHNLLVLAMAAKANNTLTCILYYPEAFAVSLGHSIKIVFRAERPSHSRP